MKLDREKYMLPDELKRLLMAVRTRVRVSAGGDGPWRRVGAPHPNQRRDFALLCLGAMTGLRVSELVGFRWGDLRGVHGESSAERPGKLRVRRSKKRDRRTGGPVYDEITFAETARKALSDFAASLPPSARDPVERVFPITVRTAERIFKTYAKRAGLPSSLSIHSMRHTHAIELFKKYKDIQLVQSALGHADIKTTQVYLHAVGQDEKLADMDIQLGGENDVE